MYILLYLHIRMIYLDISSICIFTIYVCIDIFLFFKKSSPKDRFIDFRERSKGREIHRQLPPVRALTWDRTYNLGMCPDQELNPRPELLVYVPTLPPTEPPARGNVIHFNLQVHKFTSCQHYKCNYFYKAINILEEATGEFYCNLRVELSYQIVTWKP